jgi:hypothetical protein
LKCAFDLLFILIPTTILSISNMKM